MALALSADGMPVYIENAINGKACNSTCIGCGCPVIAKNRGKVAFHYSHDPEFYDHDACSWSPETELHLMAKMVIVNDEKLMVPIGTIKPKFKIVHFEDIKLEKRVGSRIPDIIAYCGGELILIEIAVTHACGVNKISEMKRSHINCLEIDLSEFNFGESALNFDVVKDFISQAPIRWLSISPVGDIGQMTYWHNLNLQRPLAAKIRELSSELQRIENEEASIRAKYQHTVDTHNAMLSKINELSHRYNEQKKTILRNGKNLERLKNLDEDLHRLAKDEEALKLKIRSVHEREQILCTHEASLRDKQTELVDIEERLYSVFYRESEEKLSQMKADVEIELKAMKEEAKRKQDRLNKQSRNFEKVLEERVEQRIEDIKRKLHSDIQRQKANILDGANTSRNRTIQLISPIPAKLKKQFSLASSFANPPYEVIKEIEEIIEQLSKR